MSIRVNCPSCQTEALVPDSAAGMRGKCRKCGGVVRVPSEPVAAQAAVATPTKQLCPTCQWSFPPDLMDSSGSCKRCAARGIKTRLGLGALAAITVIGAILAFLFVPRSSRSADAPVISHVPERSGENSPPKAQAIVAASTEPAPAKIHGSGFIRFRSGQSEILRGLTIYLLKPTIAQEVHSPIYTKLTEVVSYERSQWASNVEDWKKDRIVADRVPRGQEMLAALEAMIAVLAREQQMAAVPSEELFQSIRNANLYDKSSFRYSVGDLNGLYSARKTVADDDLWAKAVSGAIIEKSMADADGRFNLSAKPGKYVLYAAFQTEHTIAEWAIPIDAGASGDLTVMLTNDNARIVN